MELGHSWGILLVPPYYMFLVNRVCGINFKDMFYFVKS